MKQQTTRLNENLNNYSHQAKRLCERVGNWSAYAAVAGSTLAMATSASASIISEIPATPITLSAPGHSHKTQGVNLTGMPGFNLYLVHGATLGIATARLLGSSNVGVLGSTTNQFGNFIPHFLQAGVQVGASGQWSGGNELDFLNGSVKQGNWPGNGAKGFEGIRFQTHSGQFDYGWAELSVTVDGTGHPDSMTLYGIAYDNTGAAIGTGESGVSGASGSTPEPGTAGLMLLALGAAGVGVLRRHRTR